MYQTDSGRSPSIQDLVYQTFLRCQFYFIHAFIANMYILSFPVCIGKTLFLGTSVQREFFYMHLISNILHLRRAVQ